MLKHLFDKGSFPVKHIFDKGSFPAMCKALWWQFFHIIDKRPKWCIPRVSLEMGEEGDCWEYMQGEWKCH